jgi:phosphoglycolate phosphatase-like HAD superfamily hydrolase
MLISIDYDGTIVEEKNYPQHGTPLPGAVRTIEQLDMLGHKLILNTLREGILLSIALEYLDFLKILDCFYLINKNCPIQIQKYNRDPRKIAADLIIDDKILGWAGWQPVRDFFKLD